MDLEILCQKAKDAKRIVGSLTSEEKNNALRTVAKLLMDEKEFILLENAKDIMNASQNGMHIGLIDRLRLNDDRIKAMADGLIQICDLDDPIGEVMETFTRPNALEISKTRVPLGVIGIIYESRPNVTADAFGLCFKSGNVALLKGGSDAINSNKAIADTIRKGLDKAGVTMDALGLIESTDRATTTAFMKMKDYVDVLIPRGSARLINAVVENSTIPVIETGTGNCHIYIDEFADPKKAKDIIINAKTQRIGVCNAAESIVVHEKVKDTILKEVGEALKEKNVEIRADESARLVLDCSAASDEDFATEYLDYIISVKTVSSIDEAICHINHYNTGHSDAIITENEANADKFLKLVDSACVYVNASTRFTDGFEFGFGAEIGISTQMLHARGPMGLKELTTYKYQIRGNGQVRP